MASPARRPAHPFHLALAVATLAAALASALQQDPAVMYADPVRRVVAQTTPNDPLFGIQWSLTDPASEKRPQHANAPRNSSRTAFRAGNISLITTYRFHLGLRLRLSRKKPRKTVSSSLTTHTITCIS